MTAGARPLTRPEAIRRSTDVASVAAFAALIIALGIVYIPLPFSPVPVTGQTLGVLLAANILGARKGTAAVVLVLLLAAAGLPVLAGGRGGIGVFLGPSGGFLIGFAIAAVVVGILTQRLAATRRDTIVRIAVNATLGVFAVYVTGVPWFAVASDRGFWEAVTVGMAPYIPGDVFKAVIAALAAQALIRAGVIQASGRW